MGAWRLFYPNHGCREFGQNRLSGLLSLRSHVETSGRDRSIVWVRGWVSPTRALEAEGGGF